MSRYVDANALAHKVVINGDADFINKVTKLMIDALSIDICFCEECMFADEEPIVDGRYWCAVHQCFMHFCSDGKEKSKR